MPDRFVDDRGEILDILPGPIDCVTRITTKPGKVRGNHVHAATTQWTFIVSGRMLFASMQDDGRHEEVHGPGDLVCEPAGVQHAWRAETDCTVLVFTKGPRSGTAYESDTIRLEVPLLT